MTGPKKRKAFINLLLALLVVALAIVPLVMKRDAEFAGADGEAEKVIAEVRPGYEPWYKPLWEPPSGEVESLLFALQAAVGSGFIGYYFGYQRGKKKDQEKA
ncbi:MAG: energy-coupling factor ABC transporter substrate-binding protein [Actinobacteria bacterium]|nr:energy-coupling factor ABC transporter substrate-binding protein [Actinomycetota bacterium]